MLINTRPKELSNKIIEICNTENIEIENVPLSKIEFYSDEINSKIYDEVDKKICNFSNLIFTSQAAAKYGANLLNSKLCFDRAKHNIFAVGEATKSILSEQGFEVIVPKIKSSNGLIDLIKKDFPGKNLIFCGENSNMNLQNALKEQMEEIKCYKLVFDKSQLQKIPSHSAIILVYNFLTFKFIYENIDNESLKNKTFVIASERIKSKIFETFNISNIKKNIIVSKTYLDKDMLDTVKKLI